MIWVGLVALIAYCVWFSLIRDLPMPLIGRAAAALAALVALCIVAGLFMIGIFGTGKWSKSAILVVLVPIMVSALGSWAGRQIFKGAALVPRIHQETWGGLISGMIASAAVLVAYGFYIEGLPGVENDPWADAPGWIALGFGMSLLAQCGRLLFGWIGMLARGAASPSQSWIFKQSAEFSASAVVSILGAAVFFAAGQSG